MSMIGNLIRVSGEKLNSFLNNPELLEESLDEMEESESFCLTEIDKSWDAINYILTGRVTGELDNDPSPLERAFFSFQYIDEEQDLGYGPANYLTPEQVKETYLELEIMTEEIVSEKFNGTEMNEIGIYPEIWDQEESLEYLLDYFFQFKEFYKKASDNNQAIITFLN